MSVDHEHPYDVLAMNGASAALMLSDIPFPAPVGAVRIGQDSEGSFIVNPEEEWLLESPLDLVVAGTEEAILMVEAGASEVTEAEILDALDEQFDPPTEFVVPGGNVTAAWLDHARTVVRRAERHSLAAAEPPSLVVPYLNRLSDLLWTMARWQEAADGSTLRVRDVGTDGQTDA